jgi:RND family efflux transporter MFP subunit
MTERIARSTIYAPSDGIIRKIWLEKGEVAVTGETVMSIGASVNQIEADISELDIVKINPGQSAEIVFDAFPGQTFSGKVISIDPEELDKDGDTYYRVNFSMDTPIEGIRPGMSSDIKVDVRTKIGILSAPTIAVYKRDGKEYAKTLRNGKVEEILITTGIYNGESIEILSGLKLGDLVIISAD